MGSTLAEEDSGILLVRIEVGRVAYPSGHKFTIGGGNHALLNADRIHLSEHFVIDMGELDGLLAHLNAADFIWGLIALAASNKGLIVNK